MAKAKDKPSTGVKLITQFGSVDLNEVTDKDYKRALEIGVAELIKLGEIVYADIAWKEKA